MQARQISCHGAEEQQSDACGRGDHGAGHGGGAVRRKRLELAEIDVLGKGGAARCGLDGQGYAVHPASANPHRPCMGNLDPDALALTNV